jgi:uncharacterized protein (TIGR02452 family)
MNKYEIIITTTHAILFSILKLNLKLSKCYINYAYLLLLSMYRPNKDTRVKIYEDTINKCMTRYMPSLLPTPSFKLTLLMSELIPMTPTHKTSVIVENSDVVASIINLASTFVANDNKMLVLNLASWKKYGGGVARGAMAQEEELFRKTDYGIHYGAELYPLKMNEFVCTPNVTVVKDEHYRDILPMIFVRFDAIAIAGISNPSLTSHNTLVTRDYELTKNKIETIFKFAILNGHTNLVLGALGCGVFNNPPNDIIAIYNYCLCKYNGFFKNVVFAIKSTNDSNFDLFNEKIIRL